MNERKVRSNFRTVSVNEMHRLKHLLYDNCSTLMNECKGRYMLKSPLEFSNLPFFQSRCEERRFAGPADKTNGFDIQTAGDDLQNAGGKSERHQAWQSRETKAS